MAVRNGEVAVRHGGATGEDWVDRREVNEEEEESNGCGSAGLYVSGASAV